MKYVMILVLLQVWAAGDIFIFTLEAGSHTDEKGSAALVTALDKAEGAADPSEETGGVGGFLQRDS